MFYKKSEADYRTALPGVRYKTLAVGEKTHLTEFRLSKGSTIPRHAHPHEQTGYLVSGRMSFIIGGETLDAEPGDGWSIGGNVVHMVDILEDSVVIEVFSPAREDYLP
jgi:quercetin dioxygenase-like cupin family protein